MAHYRELLRVQFYASKPRAYSNRLFSFVVPDEEKAIEMLLRFVRNGNYIKSAWLQSYNVVSGAFIKHSNNRLNADYLKSEINIHLKHQ